MLFPCYSEMQFLLFFFISPAAESFVLQMWADLYYTENLKWISEASWILEKWIYCLKIKLIFSQSSFEGKYGKSCY